MATKTRAAAFGWCLDGKHDKCPRHIQRFGGELIECGCDCHDGEALLW